MLNPPPFHDGKLTMVVYSTKIMLVINCKDVISVKFLWLSWCDIILSCGSYCLKVKTRVAAFACLFYVGIHVDPIYVLTCEHSFLCLYEYCVFVLVPYLVVMKVQLLFLFWWSSCLWLPSHPWMTNMAAVSLVLQPLWMVNTEYEPCKCTEVFIYNGCHSYVFH